MPFIKKGNVQEYILRNPECNRLELVSRFPLDQAPGIVHWTLDLTSSAQTYHISLGLTHLHAHNVIHGDLKALNVLIDDGPKALLADFGLSKIKANSNSKLTKTGDILQGSLCWMAPEIFQGKRMKTPCDIYALAMTIFEVVLFPPPSILITHKCTIRSLLERCHGQMDNSSWLKILY